MLKTAIIAVAATVIVLFVINLGSLLVLPPCAIEQVVPSSGQHNSQHQSADELCPAPEGVIVAGVKQITQVLPPDAWTALATVIMALFTGMLSIVAYQQIGLARNEFLATNRPILRVRYFRQVGAPADQIQVRFAVVNAGKSPAHLRVSCVVIEFLSDLGPPVYLAGKDVVIPRKFEIGASDEYAAFGNEKAGTIKGHQSYGSNLYIYGYLDYADDAGNTRMTAFGRRLVGESGRFTKVEDPDYEYED
jgi:hypothetical protein